MIFAVLRLQSCRRCDAEGDVVSSPVRLLVLCGHTHSGGHVQIADNVEVLTGEARYGHPTIQRVLEVG